MLFVLTLQWKLDVAQGISPGRSRIFKAQRINRIRIRIKRINRLATFGSRRSAMVFASAIVGSPSAKWLPSNSFHNPGSPAALPRRIAALEAANAAANAGPQPYDPPSQPLPPLPSAAVRACTHAPSRPAHAHDPR